MNQAVPQIRRLAALGSDERERLLARSLPVIFDPALWASMRDLYDEVAQDGDDALRRALARFDGVEAGDLRVSGDEIDAAAAGLSPALSAAIDEMIARLRAVNERILQDASWQVELEPGLVVGERAHPIASVALYVPSGKGSFPSVMAHLGGPAVVAGVPRIVVLCPPERGTGRVDPAVLYTASRLGLRDVFRVNGPSGIAAAVLGTTSVPHVRKVVGPGSPAVTVAQLLAQEHGVLTNVLQGPSESLVLADGSADPDLLAADLLTEAEHGNDSAATLLTWDELLARDVAERVRARLEMLPEPHRGHAATALSQLGGILLVDDEEQACRFADEYAVEHLQIVTRDPDATLARLHYASEVLIGQTTPMAAANFTIGVPNTLPSGGFAQVSSGVTVRTFLATSSLARLDAGALARVAPAAREIARHEGFPAHVAALDARLDGSLHDGRGPA